MQSLQMFCVITTIQRPTPAVLALAARLRHSQSPLIAIGDRKGPTDYPLEGARFLSLAAQLDLPYRLARELPVGHYARKNLGYLDAIAAGAECIYETDDDNAPLEGWQPRVLEVDAQCVESLGWINVYRCFSDRRIWPRGLPLDELTASFARPVALGAIARVRAPIQQGLADGSPDVDAIWRLVFDEDFQFDERAAVVLRPGAWCPFNSQSTWWWPEAYPLLYLPSHCSFRMTDIWRSFIAQRCLWELDLGVVFHASEVFQDRNEHNLMRDFNDEVPGYQRNRELASVLEATALEKGVDAVPGNVRRCYEALVARDFFPSKELMLVDAWLADLEGARSSE